MHKIMSELIYVLEYVCVAKALMIFICNISDISMKFIHQEYEKVYMNQNSKRG